MGLRQSLRVATGTLLLACGLQFAHTNSDPYTIMFGVAPGPYSNMVKRAIAPTLKEKDYRVVVHEFSSYVRSSMALSNGSIDANLFQHSLYFDRFTADKGLELSKLIVAPTAEMRFYSHRIKNLDGLKKRDVITLSNDPTNLARGLRFLQSIGLITARDNIDPTKASERDIASSPKELVFKPLEAVRLPRTPGGVTSALVNGSFAVAVKMDLASAIKREHLDEDLRNIIAVRSESVDRPFAEDTAEAMKSPTYHTVIDDPQNICSVFQRPE